MLIYMFGSIHLFNNYVMLFHKYFFFKFILIIIQLFVCTFILVDCLRNQLAKCTRPVLLIILNKTLFNLERHETTKQKIGFCPCISLLLSQLSYNHSVSVSLTTFWFYLFNYRIQTDVPTLPCLRRKSIVTRKSVTLRS